MSLADVFLTVVAVWGLAAFATLLFLQRVFGMARTIDELRAGGPAGRRRGNSFQRRPDGA